MEVARIGTAPTQSLVLPPPQAPGGMVLPDATPGGSADTASLRIPERTAPAVLHHRPVVSGADVLAVVSDSNALVSKVAELRKTPEGMEHLTTALSGSDGGLQLLQSVLQQRRSVVQTVNSGEHRTDEFPATVVSLQKSNRALAEILSA